ncbi:MAG TPA: hypothetical protein VHB20_04055 [Verrucomicrobiae bacterium]|jgi:hypothetical protein|nr:hypothetical protein [Verrucomicrobiae bacterium]
MKKLIVALGCAVALATGALAQNTNLTFIPGKLVVYRAGDGVITITSGRQHPGFVEEYDTAATNQTAPLLSIELPTNGPDSLWLNAHAGSEGQGFTRSADRKYLVISGYGGDLGTIPGTPSGATNSSGVGYPRGFGIIDAFTNYHVPYASADWFGMQPGITQNNPRGVATDGSNNFWGCGTIAGTQTGGLQETGTLFWNSDISPTPELVQSVVQSAYFMKIINGSLYMVAKNEAGGALANGIYNFVDFSGNGGEPVPLPWAPGNVQHIVTTNLFLNFGAALSKVLAFDMDPAGTTVYAADNALGIVKFVNSGGTWTSPYTFSPTNIGSAKQGKGGTGCFGIAVDFSGENPVIYATTMDLGDGANTCSNRLIAIVDDGNPGTNLVAKTLAVANGINEVFRGVAFTPEVLPAITAQPVDVNTTTNVAASLTVGVDSVYAVHFQWQKDGVDVTDNANISGSNTNVLVFRHADLTNAGDYSVIVTNQYGAVTSVVASVAVSAVAVAPSLTNGVAHLTNFIGNNAAFTVNPNGTPEFTYQWYFGATMLTDDGVKYSGSTASTLYVTNLQLADAGSYYVAIHNAGGESSNLVAVLSVQFVVPSIAPGGDPTAITMLVGQTNALGVSSVSGTEPLSYQWYRGVPGSASAVSDLNEFSGSETNDLTISGASLGDAGSYFVIINNAGGSATSLVATVTVVTPPPLSFVAYSNQVYAQEFDSLPDPGSIPVNTVGGGGPVTIGGITYSVANPFDFAYPLFTNITAGDSGGLNLAATMSGWYGECDLDTQGAQLGASDGSQTTGGVISFGTLDNGSNNRSLGLIATSTSGGTHFGLKLVNETSANLNYIDLGFVGEYWKLGTKPKTLAFTYAIDPAGASSTLSAAEIAAAQANPVSSLNVSFPIASKVGANNGNAASNQVNLAVTNLALATPWQPGSALWLVWSINDATGSGQGYGIDHLRFSASSSTNAPALSQVALGSIAFSSVNGLSFSFTNAPGASTDFSIRVTTNLGLPLNQWLNLGHPNEVSPGNYQFADGDATNQAQKFYTLTSP